MFTFLVLVVHVVVCIALILIILLQSGKGADIGAVFGGGGGGTVFGPTGAATVFSKITIIAAVVFMVTSIVLSYFSAGKMTSSDRSVVAGQSETQPVPPGTTTGKSSQPDSPAQKAGAKEAPEGTQTVPAPQQDTGPAKAPAQAGSGQPAAPAPAPPAPEQK